MIFIIFEKEVLLLKKKVKAATEKRKSLIDAGLVNPMGIDNAEISKVFGPDKGKSVLLGYFSHTSKIQTLQANLATSVMAAKGARMDDIELERTTQLITKLWEPRRKTNFHEIWKTSSKTNLHKLWKTSSETNILPTVNANPYFDSPSHIENTVLAGVKKTQDGVQFVHLFNRKRLTVATGYVIFGKEGEVCHGVQVFTDERKIRLESIYDGDCKNPDAPQGDDRNYLWKYNYVAYGIHERMNTS